MNYLSGDPEFIFNVFYTALVCGRKLYFISRKTDCDVHLAFKPNTLFKFYKGGSVGEFS